VIIGIVLVVLIGGIATAGIFVADDQSSIVASTIADSGDIQPRHFAAEELLDKMVQKQLEEIQRLDRKVHVVFSTDCSFYQDWQAEVLVYSHLVHKWPGRITRIASCGKKDWKPPKISHPNYSVVTVPNFNPNITIRDDYAPRNRPHSLKFVFEKYPKTFNQDDIVFLVDPDQIILRPYSDIGVSRKNPTAAGYSQGTDYLLWANRYCSSCDVKKLSWEQMKDLRIGAPYIIHIQDLMDIVPHWIDIMEGIRRDEAKDKKGGWVSDMFAYSIAAVKIGLVHRRMSYMVSNVGDNGEPWHLIQNGSVTDPTLFMIHYCQAITVKNYRWNKHEFKSKDLLSCDVDIDSKLFPLASGETLDWIEANHVKSLARTKDRDHDSNLRNAWLYKNALVTANSALRSYHTNFCNTQ
jgi:hypothetical protein